ncbi:DUF333 domain-containing protein [Vibrio sp. E150_011]
MKTTLTAVLVSSLFLYGCAKSDVAKEEADLNMANPAAVFCSQHGTYDLATGKCALKSGETVDAWTYYREHNSADKTEAQRFCEAKKGVYLADKKQCELANGDVMDAMDYFRDHQSSSN